MCLYVGRNSRDCEMKSKEAKAAWQRQWRANNRERAREQCRRSAAKRSARTDEARAAAHAERKAAKARRRFADFTDKGANDGSCCWNWLGYVNHRTGGYGQFSEGGRIRKAHRVALEWHLGRPLVGHVLHSCDNPRCVRPSHLREGSHQDNMRDVADRDRAWRVHGSENRLSRLTESQVRLVRQMSGSGVKPSQIAKCFGIDYTHVWRIVTRRAWAHI